MDWSFIKRLGYRVVRFGERFDSNGALTLSGDRDLEWSWVVAQASSNVNRTLDFGPGNSSTPTALSFISDEVVALDLNVPDIQYGVKNIKHVLGDITAPPPGLGTFDLIVNCSTIEHVGLPGRYGSKEAIDGDLIGMQNLLGMMNSSAKMLMTIPVGIDGVYLPNHRVYGNDRLPKLLKGYKIETERYFAKTESKRFWAEVSKEEALATRSSGSFYSIGLFVLLRDGKY
jgi:hypothetical protein